MVTVVTAWSAGRACTETSPSKDRGLRARIATRRLSAGESRERLLTNLLTDDAWDTPCPAAAAMQQIVARHSHRGDSVHTRVFSAEIARRPMLISALSISKIKLHAFTRRSQCSHPIEKEGVRYQCNSRR